MRETITCLLIIAGILGSALPPTDGHVAFADEGWDGPGTMRWRLLPDMMRGMGMPGPWWHAGAGDEGPLISMMLVWKGQLALTADQERSLIKLRANFEKEAIKRTSDIEVAELELKELLEQQMVDMAKIESQVKNIALLQADLRFARIKTIEAGKAVLTPDQHEKLQRLVQDSRTGKGGMGMMWPGIRPMWPPAW